MIICAYLKLFIRKRRDNNIICTCNEHILTVYTLICSKLATIVLLESYIFILALSQL